MAGSWAPCGRARLCSGCVWSCADAWSVLGCAVACVIVCPTGWAEAVGAAKASSKFAQSDAACDVPETVAVAEKDCAEVCDEVEGGGVMGVSVAELEEREDLCGGAG